MRAPTTGACTRAPLTRACAFFRPALRVRGRRRGNATMPTGMTSAAPPRVLVVAHRTAATPRLLDEVRSAPTVPIPSRCWCPRPYWDPDTDEAAITLGLAIPLLSEAAGGKVEGIVGDSDPFVAVQQTLERGDFDELIISTLPARVSRWLRRDLPPPPRGGVRPARHYGHRRVTGARPDWVNSRSDDTEARFYLSLAVAQRVLARATGATAQISISFGLDLRAIALPRLRVTGLPSIGSVDQTCRPSALVWKEPGKAAPASEESGHADASRPLIARRRSARGGKPPPAGREVLRSHDVA